MQNYLSDYFLHITAKLKSLTSDVVSDDEDGAFRLGVQQCKRMINAMNQLHLPTQGKCCLAKPEDNFSGTL